MLEEFAVSLSLVKKRAYKIDGSGFSLHYIVTFLLLITVSVVIAIYASYFGVIACMQDSKSVQAKDKAGDFPDSYAFIQGTSIMEKCEDSASDGQDSSPKLHHRDSTTGKDERSHRVYIWIPIILFVQALAFYAPHALWKYIENGHIKMLAGELTGELFDTPEGIKTEGKERISSYLKGNLGYYNSYFWSYIFCEVLNWLNILAQIGITHAYCRFIEFVPAALRYFTQPDELLDPVNKVTKVNHLWGIHWIWNERRSQDQGCYHDVNPMLKYFPPVTRFSMEFTGAGGNKQKFDGICVLPLNAFYQQFYLFLWFWFMALAAVASITLVYRAVLICSPYIRARLLKSKCATANEEDVRRVLEGTRQVGDWFILYQLSKNLNSEIMNQVVTSLAEDIEERKGK